MVRNKLALALLLVGLQCLSSVEARVEDPPFFSSWMLEFYRATQQHQLDRLPCRVSKACVSLGRGAARRHGRKLATRHKANSKLAQRVQSPGYKGSVAETGTQTFAMPPGFMVLSDAGNKRLGVDIDAPAAVSPPVDDLAGYLDEVHTAVPPRTVADATGGVGDSAYGALYDFDDESGGETQRGFVEIPTVLASQTATVAAIPEPGTLLLFGAGLLGWGGRRWRARPAAGVPRIA